MSAYTDDDVQNVAAMLADATDSDGWYEDARDILDAVAHKIAARALRETANLYDEWTADDLRDRADEIEGAS